MSKSITGKHDFKAFFPTYEYFISDVLESLALCVVPEDTEVMFYLHRMHEPFQIKVFEGLSQRMSLLIGLYYAVSVCLLKVCVINKKDHKAQNRFPEEISHPSNFFSSMY